jgi:hypothetical protein
VKKLPQARCETVITEAIEAAAYEQGKPASGAFGPGPVAGPLDRGRDEGGNAKRSLEWQGH